MSTLEVNSLQHLDATVNNLDLDSSGNVNLIDNNKLQFGTGNDLQIYHNGSYSYIHDSGTGPLYIRATDLIFKSAVDNDDYAKFYENGAVEFFYSNSKKIETTSTGVAVTGVLSATQGRVPLVVDNDGSFDLNAGQNFSCTPTANIALAFTNIPNGQSGYILLANATPYTISISASTVKASDKATFLSTVSTAGTYLISYISDGTNVYLTNSLVLT